MECCYPAECREYSVTPVLVSPNCPTKCCEEAPLCFPCLPRCPKGVVYCCEKKRPKAPPRSPTREEEHCLPQECYSRPRRSPSSPPPTRRNTSPHGCTTCCHPTCKPVKTKYVIPCYRYEDGRIVSKLPVTAFKRNGMQDQEHSKMLGTANFLFRCPQDVSIECDVCTNPVKVGDPAKVPKCTKRGPLNCCLLRKKPIEVSLEDILDD